MLNHSYLLKRYDKSIVYEQFLRTKRSPPFAKLEDKPIGNNILAEEQDESVTHKEEPIDRVEDKPARQYYSLAKAYELAVQDGFVGTQSSFRERIGRRETLFGWGKELGLGNKPCYFRE